MKLYVTGATGFVGGHFVNAAHAAGHEIFALRRENSVPVIPLIKQPHWVAGALDSDQVANLSGCDVFVHLAAHSANAPYDSFAKCMYWNVYASLALAEQAKASGIDCFLVAGSAFEYGTAADRYERVPVDAPLEPTTSYPASKAAASIAFKCFAQQANVKLKLLRIFQVYGEGELATRLWPSLRRAALAGEDLAMSPGRQVRDFINVNEVASALVAALDFRQIEPGATQVQNVGTGTPQTVRAFAEHWWQHWGAKGELKFGDGATRPGEVMRLVAKL